MDTQVLARLKTPLLALSVVIILWAMLGALDVRNRTYTGYATDGNNTITGVTEGSPADRAGLAVGDYIRSIGGIAIEDVRAIAARGRPGINETRTIDVERDGRSVSFELSYDRLSAGNLLVAYGAIAIGVLFLLFGAWAFLTAPSATTMLLAALGVTFSPALTVGPYFESAAVRTAVGVVLLLLIVVGFAVLTHFLMAFPKRKRSLQRGGTYLIIYGPAILVGLLSTWLLAAQPAATSAVNVFFRVLFALFLVVYFAAALIALIHSYVKAVPQERGSSGLNLLLLGTVVGLGPTLVISIVGLVAPRVVVPGAFFLPLGIGLIPVTFALAAVRGSRDAHAIG